MEKKIVIMNADQLNTLFQLLLNYTKATGIRTSETCELLFDMLAK